MVELTGLVAAIAAAALASVWALGAFGPENAIAARAPAWFVALKRDGVGAPDLAAGVTVRWSARADFPFIGAEEAYWSDFMILSGGDAATAPVTLGAETADAFIARVDLVRPPPLALGLLKALALSGLASRPRGAPTHDLQTLGYDSAFMPSRESIAGLVTRPQSYAPAMVNFLQYKGADGQRAYARYGRVALRTVYRTGGRLLFFGRIAKIVRKADAGPCAGGWDDVAAMRYDRPEAILTMEHAPDYRAALRRRDKGLARTVVIASTPEHKHER